MDISQGSVSVSMKRIVGLLLLVVGISLFSFVWYRQNKFNQVNRTFSPYSILASSWEKYKLQFISEDGRVLDRTQNDITTSEGQSYAMLRAVWIDDKETFDKVWKFSKENMKRPHDNLLGWRYGEKEDGSYGLLGEGGDNSASDADCDIALALLFAYKRWNDNSYISDAKLVMDDIWELEVDRAGGRNYMVAGNWAKGGDKLVVNPSYFAPYAWRIFHQVDGTHPWESLIDPAYDVLNKSGQSNLNKQKSAGLPPDWIAIDRASGALETPQIESLKTDYSFDAMRVPFRIALDYKWFGDGRDKDYLRTSFPILSEQFTQTGKIASSFSHDGTVINQNENPSMYATSLGYFIVENPELARRIYEEKIVRLYANSQDAFDTNLPYYDQNWLWFGTALYHNFLINLWEK